MSNSRAAAVLTTPDLAAALRAVRSLLDIADLDPAEVDFEGVIHSQEVLARVRAVHPDLNWWALSESERGSSKTGYDPADWLPIRFHDWCHPLDMAEPFIAALGPSPAAIRWDLNAWPEVPEAGLQYISQKYAYLTLALNSQDIYQDEPSNDHTVYVHVPSDHHTARIEWLAAQVGGRFAGRIEIAPL